jgi:hypothetical protein
VKKKEKKRGREVRIASIYAGVGALVRKGTVGRRKQVEYFELL